MSGVAVTVCVVVSTATGAGADSEPRPVRARTAAALAAAVQDRGLGCDPFVDAEDTPGSALPGAPEGDTGECTVKGATASLAVYADRRELGRALDAIPMLCGFVMAVIGPVEFTFVTGRNWSVSTFSDEYHPAIARKLGGKVREVDCTKT